MSDINEESPKWGSKQSLVFFFGYYKYRYCTSSKGKRCLTLSLFKFLCLKLFHRSVFFFHNAATTSCFGTSAGRGGVGRVGAAVIQPLIEAPSTRVHEEVADSGELQAQLLRDGDL